VLEKFQASEVYRGCLGKAGGITRAEFEAAVLELERKAHPPMTELPDFHVRFFRQAQTLAAFTVAEATAPVSETRKAEILEVLRLNGEQFQWVEKQAMWDWREPGAAEQKLEVLLNSERERAANLHAVKVFERCLRWALREHGGGLAEAVIETLERIGGWCYLNKREVRLVRETLTEDILAESHQGLGRQPRVARRLQSLLAWRHRLVELRPYPHRLGRRAFAEFVEERLAVGETAAARTERVDQLAQLGSPLQERHLPGSKQSFRGQPPDIHVRRCGFVHGSERVLNVLEPSRTRLSVLCESLCQNRPQAGKVRKIRGN
jgi:hypothetical protein